MRPRYRIGGYPHALGYLFDRLVQFSLSQSPGSGGPGDRDARPEANAT